MQNTNTATVLVIVGTGSKYEEKRENGISHFLEHMAFKGTKKRPTALKISSEIDAVGGIFNAFTGFEYTGYWAKVGSQHINLAIDIIDDMMKNSILDEKEIEKEKGVIIEEINMYEDNPMMDIENVFYNLLYGDQPAGWDVAGTKETVKSFSRKDFVNYKKDHYNSLNTLIAVSGNIELNKVGKDLKKRLGASPEKKSKEKVLTKEDKNRPKILIKHKETSQSHYHLGGFCYNLNNEKNVIAKILFAILGGGMSSRLFESIREKNGLAYYVSAENEAYTDSGVYAISAGVKTKNIEKAIKISTDELKKIKSKKVLSKELERAKNMIKGHMLISFEKSDSLARWFAMQEILENCILTPEEYFAKINAVTAEQIQDVANELFTNDNLRLAMIGPHKDERKFEKLLKI
ncbi:MAG: pitrilysin family protein [bacterium]